MLASCVLALGFAALAAVGFERSSAAFNNAAASLLAALAVMAAAPAALGAFAPKGFWLRLLYAGLAAGLILALRRLLLQWNLGVGVFDEGLALAVAAAATFILAAGAPLWRAALAHSLIGVGAMLLGVSGGLAVAAIETAAGATAGAAGASLALGAGAGAALAVQIAASFSRLFAEDDRDAAAAAARHGAAPALFILAIGVAAIFAVVFSEAGGVLSATLVDLRIALAAIGFAVAAPLIMLPAALSLKPRTERTAVIENRRRAALRPFLDGVRQILPPSSALAASAVWILLAIAAAFETTVAAGIADIGLAAAILFGAALVFVSLRTALALTVFGLVAGKIMIWAIEILGFPVPTETARAAAAMLAAVLAMQMFLAWRDRRDARRKTREVVRLALADSLPGYVASSVLAASAMAATEAAGFWSEGAEAALLTAGLAALGLVAAPPIMTAIGALFGKR